MKLAIALLLFALSAPVLADNAHLDQRVSYTRDVKPILERNCVVCHACYDAPCQLKLESPEGLLRGATKARVYGARPKAQAPTRVHFDASSTAAWRQKGFFSVTDGGKDSLLSRMLELGKKNAPKANSRIPDSVELGITRENQCPTQEEFAKYEHRRMHEGMPFGMAPLRPDTLYTLQAWLAQGAEVDEPEIPPSDEAMQLITAWESFLNASDTRGQLLGRYIYEHLFLAHLHLDDKATEGFFEIVRSSTPPGSPIEVIATRRPNDDPKGPCYYRLRPIRDSIVQKTHITYPFGADKLERVKAIFAAERWTVDELPSYGLESSVNPFKTFEAIPAKLRYQFMLDNAYYYVNSFIRGPVCLGNIATDVIQDHFFNMWQTPGSDLFCNDPEYAKAASEHLALKAREGFRLDVMPSWMRAEQRYTKMRGEKYKDVQATMDDIWHGDGTNPDAQVTVFRNSDSATVVRGLRGTLPKTIWVMDYPIFERTYYLLVVNFDVFGSAVHQVQTRLYFDLLRAESEVNFMRWMPAESRETMFKSWYRGSVASLKSMAVYPALDLETPTQMKSGKGDPKAEFVSQLRARMPALSGPEGDITGNSYPKLDQGLDASLRQMADSALLALQTGTASQYPYIKLLPDVTFVRVGFGDAGQDLAYTLIHNRAHKNVAFMFRETSRLDPDNDYVTVLRGPVGCYPNFIFQIPPAKLNEFVTQLAGVTDEEAFREVVRQYGVGRTHPSFWSAFDFFRKYQQRINPLERGIFDANRYANY